MALQTSGTIAITDLQQEFTWYSGSLSAYYRDGPIVPGTIPGGYIPGNTVPGNPRPGNPRPGTSVPCRGGTLEGGVPGSATIVMKTINGTASRGTLSYSSGGPQWSKQMACSTVNDTCRNDAFSMPCNGENVFWRDVPAVVGASATQPCTVNYVFNPPTTNPPTTNPPTTNPPTTNPPYNSPPQSINQPVPTSGTISLSNFYGAYKP